MKVRVAPFFILKTKAFKIKHCFYRIKMAEKKQRKKSSTKRFGPRYGRLLREKVAEIEAGHRGRHKCPYCSKKSVKRLAVGIWFCRSCKSKFTGRSYSLLKKAVVKEEENEKISKNDKTNQQEKPETPKETKEDVKDGKV